VSAEGGTSAPTAMTGGTLQRGRAHVSAEGRITRPSLNTLLSCFNGAALT